MLLIQGGILHTMEGPGPFQGDLLIREGKIARIAQSIPPTEAMKIFDARGLQVFPGFIDAHSHLGIAPEKATGQGDETNEGTNPITPCMRAIDARNHRGDGRPRQRQPHRRPVRFYQNRGPLY